MFSTSLGRKMCWSTVALVALILAACPGPESDRVRLVEAAALASQGDRVAARAVFEEVLASSRQSVEARLRFAEFLIDGSELEEAGEVLEAVSRATDLSSGDQERLRNAQIRRLETLLTQVRGDAPVAPGDPLRYEEALIRLANIQGDGEARRELDAWWLSQVRAALGLSPTEPSAEQAQAVIQVARYEQVLRALEPARRLTEGDPRLTHAPALAAEIVDEALALREALEVRFFELGFEAEWRDRHRPRLVSEGRLDAGTDTLLVHFEGVLREGTPPDARLSRHRYWAQTWRAREVLTDLAYELRGVPRSGAPPLDFRIEEMAPVEVPSIEVSEDGQANARIHIPYALVFRAVRLLDLRLAQAANAQETP